MADDAERPKNRGQMKKGENWRIVAARKAAEAEEGRRAVDALVAERDAREPAPAGVAGQMRRVWEQAESWDRQPWELMLRAELKRDRLKFAEALARVEREAKREEPAAVAPGVADPDADAAKVMRLIPPLLAAVAERAKLGA